MLIVVVTIMSEELDVPIFDIPTFSSELIKHITGFHSVLFSFHSIVLYASLFNIITAHLKELVVFL